MTEVHRIRSNTPANQRCFECDTTPVNWCALSLGVFLCLDCAGIYRGLGSHNLKVRSLTLDKLSKMDLVTLELGGNNRAKKAFESKHLSKMEPLQRYETSAAYDYQYNLKCDVHKFLNIDPPTRLSEKPPNAEHILDNAVASGDYSSFGSQNSNQLETEEQCCQTCSVQ